MGIDPDTVHKQSTPSSGESSAEILPPPDLLELALERINERSCELLIARRLNRKELDTFPNILYKWGWDEVQDMVEILDVEDAYEERENKRQETAMK